MSAENQLQEAFTRYPATELPRDPCIGKARTAPRSHRLKAAARQANRVPPQELLQNDFLQQLQREKRRAERTQRPLSIALYRVGEAARKADQLLDALREASRETDTLGDIDGDMIAVLCPDTDQEGVDAFVRRVADRLPQPDFGVTAATYPDHLFDCLGDSIRSVPDMQSITFSDAYVSHVYPLKRLVDVLGATVALFLFAPIMLLAAIAVAGTSRGPIIFRQTRLGKGGQRFVCYKFRSMVKDIDDSIHRRFVKQHIQGEQETQAQAPRDTSEYKLRVDPRITSVGAFIRKTSIDELPQLFNVLKGEMSLVGPRPCVPYEAASYQPWHLRRIVSVKPGITGLWQVEGRSRVTFNEMVRMDLRYIKQCSLWVDLRILLQTVRVVLRCEGAR